MAPILPIWPPKLDRLVKAYPGHDRGVDGNELVLKDGTRLPISDGRTDKRFEELLDQPRHRRHVRLRLSGRRAGRRRRPQFRSRPRPRRGAVPRALRRLPEGHAGQGRARSPWVPKHGGGTVTFTTAQGADKALEAVSAELDQLPKSFMKYPGAVSRHLQLPADRQAPTACRCTPMRAAIDINTKQTTYWQWVKPGRGRPLPMVEQDPAGDRRRLREARLHLGRPLVSLRHHAFRVPAGAVARQMKKPEREPRLSKNISGLRRSPRKSIQPTISVSENQ